MININNIDDVFSYHSPNESQIEKLQKVRESAKLFAQAILDLTPGCVDQQTALYKVREAMMFANASIVLHGEV